MQGYLTFAQNSKYGDYLKMAYAQALSLNLHGKTNFTVAITPDQPVPDKYREIMNVIDIPWRDESASFELKFQNEWKSIHITPYDETIKTDADMLFLDDISTWFNDMPSLWHSTPMDLNGVPIINSAHRKKFKDLPSVYSAIFFFKKDTISYEFFNYAKEIFHNWSSFRDKLIPLYPSEQPSTDLVYSMAYYLMNKSEDRPDSRMFYHMKSELLWAEADAPWTGLVPYYFTKECKLWVQNTQIHKPIHYHDKSFLTDIIIEKMEKKLGL